MRSSTATCLFLACALAGCAGAPRMPAAFMLSDATLVSAATEATVTIDGPSGKGSAAAAGAAKGGGAGFLIGGLACLGAGPLAPLCLGTVVPASLAIGAATGAVFGAVRADSAENVAAKRMLLTSAMSGAHIGLAAHVQRQLRQSSAIDLPLAQTPSERSEWTLQVTLTEIATVASGPDAPYTLHASARLEALQRGERKPVFVKQYDAPSAAAMSTAQWSANDGQAARQALDDMLASLAAQMVTDLTGPSHQASAAPAPAALARGR